MKKLIFVAMLVGFLVAVAISVTGFHSHNLVATFILWPTLSLIPLDASYNTAGFVALGISVIANGILSGIVVFGAALLWKYVLSAKGRRARADGWWPSN